MTVESIPITVFTGFLGAGKTTIILSLLPQLPQDYKVVLLKNEFGDIEVDSQLAKQSSLAAVNEILNGCLCCVMVGKIKVALQEIKENFSPDRIIIESSGSAFPATLAFQIRELERETGGAFKLDAIVTVIDAENFTGYEDTSTTARMQAAYTDMLLINKWELVSERQLDKVMDDLYTLNDQTPKLRCKGKSGVPPSLIFGLDSKRGLEPNLKRTENQEEGHDEVETATIWLGGDDPTHKHEGHCAHKCNHSNSTNGTVNTFIDRTTLTEALEKVPKDIIYRVKGFVQTEESGIHVLNWAFGRYDLHHLRLIDGEGTPPIMGNGAVVRLTVMGERGEVEGSAKRLAEALGCLISV